MGTLKRIGLSALFMFFCVAFLSWQSGSYGEYCDAIESHKEKCASYNLAPFILLKFADFLHHFESAFIILSTIAIAWFTFELRKATFGLRDSTDKLWSAGESQIALIGRQTDLAEKQHGLQWNEYFATHRPRIVVTRMTVELTPDSPIKIDFVFINNGEATAKRFNWNAGILLLNSSGAIHGIFNYSTNKQGWYQSELAIGTGSTVQIIDNIPLDPRDYDDIKVQRKFLHVVGTIIYEDNLGVSRTMGFFRCYDSERRRFDTVNDAEYEFHD